MNLKDRARKLKKEIPAVFLALKDKDTPLLAKMIAAVTVGYALSPIDLIPDFIPVLGYLDDVILLPALITMTICQTADYLRWFLQIISGGITCHSLRYMRQEHIISGAAADYRGLISVQHQLD